MRWTGIVLEVWPDSDIFTAELRRDGSPDLVAEFSMAECGVRVEAGDVLDVKRNSVKKRDLGVWTQEEVDEIYRRAALRAEQLRLLSGLPDGRCPGRGRRPDASRVQAGVGCCPPGVG